MIIPPFCITVSQEFIDQRDSKSFGTKERRDAEIYEHALIDIFPATFQPSPYIYQSDITAHDLFIDCKYINSLYFNIAEKKTFDKHARAIEEGKLTHFLFWKSDNPHLTKKPLEQGESFRAEMISFVDAKTVLKESQSSQYGYKYYRVENPHRLSNAIGSK